MDGVLSPLFVRAAYSEGFRSSIAAERGGPLSIHLGCCAILFSLGTPNPANDGFSMWTFFGRAGGFETEDFGLGELPVVARAGIGSEASLVVICAMGVANS